MIKKANPSVWAGAILPKLSLNAKKADGDGSTDTLTEQPTDIAGYRVVCTQLKIMEGSQKKTFLDGRGLYTPADPSATIL